MTKSSPIGTDLAPRTRRYTTISSSALCSKHHDQRKDPHHKMKPDPRSHKPSSPPDTEASPSSPPQPLPQRSPRSRFGRRRRGSRLRTPKIRTPPINSCSGHGQFPGSRWANNNKLDCIVLIGLPGVFARSRAGRFVCRWGILGSRCWLVGKRGVTLVRGIGRSLIINLDALCALCASGRTSGLAPSLVEQSPVPSITLMKHEASRLSNHCAAPQNSEEGDVDHIRQIGLFGGLFERTPGVRMSKGLKRARSRLERRACRRARVGAWRGNSPDRLRESVPYNRFRPC